VRYLAPFDIPHQLGAGAQGAGHRAAECQADTIVPPGAQGLDRYAYVNNNSLKYNDPSGHDAGFTQYLSPAECLDKSGYTDQAKNEIANALRPQYSVVENTKTPTQNPTYSAFGTEVANYYRNASNPTWTPMAIYKPGPISTPNPFDNSTSTSQTSQIPLPYIYIDWNQVDYLNLVADGSGIVADGLTIAVFKFPVLAPVAETAQEISEPIEAVGLTVSVVEAIQSKPSGFWNLITYSAQNTVKFGARSERLVPLFGIIGNGVSLYFDLKPQIIWR